MTGRPTFAERRKALRAINRLGASLNIGLASADRMAGFQGFASKGDAIARHLIANPAVAARSKRKPKP